MNEPVKQLQQLCEICHTRPRYHEGVSVCGVCMGLEQAEEDPVQSKVASASESHEAEQSKAERPCSSCGRTPSQTRFYPSRKDKCVECIKAQQADRQAQAPKTYTELDPIVAAEIDAHPDPSERPSATCTCRQCGKAFETYNNGSAVIKNFCPDCLKQRLKKGIRRAGEMAHPSFEIKIDLEKDQEIFDALVQHAKRDRRSLDNQVITILERVLIPQKGVESCGA